MIPTFYAMRTTPLVYRHALPVTSVYSVNETPMVRGLTADNNNMQSVLIGNMETI